MEEQFPEAVPEIPVSDIDRAAAYYKSRSRVVSSARVTSLTAGATR